MDINRKWGWEVLKKGPNLIAHITNGGNIGIFRFRKAIRARLSLRGRKQRVGSRVSLFKRRQISKLTEGIKRTAALQLGLII